MREIIRPQIALGERPMGEIKLDPQSRDDMPKLLVGLQYLYVTPALREEVCAILQEIIPQRADGRQANRTLGRPGMAQWKSLVLGVLRLGLDADYDRLQELANQPQTIRPMLGHGDGADTHRYQLQTLKDNRRLFTAELLERINAVVVRAGHTRLKKSPEDALRGRCDSLVVETDVPFPTAINRLYDAIRKTLETRAALSEAHGLGGWRQSAYHLRQFQKQYRVIQQRKHSTSHDDAQRAAPPADLPAAHAVSLEQAEGSLARARQTGTHVLRVPGVWPWEVAALDGYLAPAERQIDQIRRRVLQGAVIPHAAKVCSMFQPPTEWISKGKAGVPVELGLRVCLLEDQHRFILHHPVMEKQTDDQVAVRMIDESQQRFPTLPAVSCDQGFHRPANRRDLAQRLALVAMPKKGRRSVADQARASAPAFVHARQPHSAVESAINGLEHVGLDLCPDHGIVGFKRYVALAVLARNLHRLGVVVREREARATPSTRASVPKLHAKAA